MDTLSQKISLAQIELELGGHRFRHFLLTLRGEQTIAGIREQPEQFVIVQGNAGTRLARGDELSIIAADGLTVADRCMVTRVLSGSVWLSKPLRIVQLEEVGLFDNGHERVVPVGTGFSVQSVRGGHTYDKVYATEDAAKAQILKSQPVRAA